jgi:hypothetical protein
MRPGVVSLVLFLPLGYYWKSRVDAQRVALGFVTSGTARAQEVGGPEAAVSGAAAAVDLAVHLARASYIPSRNAGPCGAFILCQLTGLYCAWVPAGVCTPFACVSRASSCVLAAM